MCPTREDYLLLAAESEYAAWTLVNAYSLNHVAISVHRLAACSGGRGLRVHALNNVPSQVRTLVVPGAPGSM